MVDMIVLSAWLHYLFLGHTVVWKFSVIEREGDFKIEFICNPARCFLFKVKTYFTLCVPNNAIMKTYLSSFGHNDA